jgi:hypothetical protein
MFFCGTQNISVLRVEMNLGVTPNDIPKVDLAIALNRILTYMCSLPMAMTKLLLRHSLRRLQVWTENNLKIFKKL